MAYGTNYQVAFVDSITPSPTTRLDLVNGVWSLQAEGTDVSPPPLRRSVVSTLLVDGQQIPAAAYANRVLTLRLFCKATTDDAAADAMQDLTTELDRAANFLRWQPGTSQPVFFRTLRAEYGSVQWDPATKFATVTIPAEPFAYGLKQLAMPPLNANPYFETSAANWTLVAGTSIARSTAQAHEGVASLLLTPDGVSATAEAGSEFITVTAGTAYTVTAWVLAAVNSTVSVSVAWYDAGQALLSTSAGSSSSATAGTWSLIGDPFTAPASAAYARFRVRETGTPSGSALLYIDEAMITAARVVNNDPAAAANGLYLDVTNVAGDVETPLFFSVWFSSVNGRATAMGVRRRGTPSAAPLFYQVEGATPSTDTSVQTNDAAMSGAGNNYQRTTFATQTGMFARMSFQPWAAVNSKDMRGMYRAFVRVRHSVSLDVIQVALKVYYNNSNYSNATATVPVTSPCLIDLGLVQIPSGVDPVYDGYSGAELLVNGNVTFELIAGRSSGSGNLDWDYFVLVPADDRFALASWTGSGGTYEFHADPTRTAVNSRGSVGEILSVSPMPVIGGLPYVSPGVTNRITWLRDVGGPSALSDSITGQSVITPYYWPRYLYVRPATT